MEELLKKKKELKYEYLLHVWGGFWNEGNIKVHGEPEVSYKWFDTAEDRDAELARLQSLAKTHGTWDSVIAYSKHEGYLTRFEHVIQSLVAVNGKIEVIENNLGYGFFPDEEVKAGPEYGSTMLYMMEYKWDISANLPDGTEPLFTTFILR